MVAQQSKNISIRSIQMFRYDYHIHTKLSPNADKKLKIQKIIEYEEKKEMGTIGFADYCYGYGYDINLIKSVRKEVSDCNSSINTFLGIEASMLDYHVPSINVRLAAAFDYVLMAPNHYYLRNVARPDSLDNPKMVAIHEIYMFEAAVNCPLTDAVVHPFLLSPLVFKMSAKDLSEFSRDVMNNIDDKRLAYALDTAAHREIAVELSPKFILYNQKHLIEFYRFCLERGVKLLIGSDAHSFKELDGLSLLDSIVAELNISERNLWHPKVWEL